MTRPARPGRPATPRAGRRRTAALLVGLICAGLLASGCRSIAGTPVAAAGTDPGANPGVAVTSVPPEQPSETSAGESTPSAAGPSSADPQGSDPTAYPEGDGVDPCELVGKADANKLAGTPLDPPVRGEHACTYTGPVTGPTAQVEVYVGLGAKKQLDIERTLDHKLRALHGTWDEAWLSDNGVYVRVGQLWVSVLVVLLEDPSQYAKRLEDMAVTVAGRL